MHQYPGVSSRLPFILMSTVWKQGEQATLNQSPAWEWIPQDCPGPVKITPTRATGKGHFSQCVWKVDTFWVGSQHYLLQWCNEGWAPNCSPSQALFRHIHVCQWNVSLELVYFEAARPAFRCYSFHKTGKMFCLFYAHGPRKSFHLWLWKWQLPGAESWDGKTMHGEDSTADRKNK